MWGRGKRVSLIYGTSTTPHISTVTHPATLLWEETKTDSVWLGLSLFHLMTALNTQPLWHSVSVIHKASNKCIGHLSELFKLCQISRCALLFRKKFKNVTFIKVTLNTIWSWITLESLNTSQTTHCCAQPMMMFFLRSCWLYHCLICRCRRVQQEKRRVWPWVQQHYGQLPLLLSPRLHVGRTPHV